MRKVLIILLLSIFSSIVNGQVQKGDVVLGANFGLMKQDADADILNYSYSNLILNFEYYVSDNVSLGFGPSLSSAKVLNDAFKINNNAWNFFVNYSFLSASGKTMPYVGVAYTLYNTKITSGDVLGAGEDLGDGLGIPIPGFGGGSNVDLETTYKRSVASLILGIKFFVTERINIDNKFTYGTVLNETIEFDIFGFAASMDGAADGNLLQFTVGFGYIIGRKGT